MAISNNPYVKRISEDKLSWNCPSELINLLTSVVKEGNQTQYGYLYEFASYIKEALEHGYLTSRDPYYEELRCLLNMAQRVNPKLRHQKLRHLATLKSCELYVDDVSKTIFVEAGINCLLNLSQIKAMVISDHMDMFIKHNLGNTSAAYEESKLKELDKLLSELSECTYKWL